MQKLLIVFTMITLSLFMASPVWASDRVLPGDTNFDYQLGGAVDRGAGVGIVERDVTDSPESGVYNICYVNAFQTQPAQRHFWLTHRGLVLQDHGKLVQDSTWGEWLLNTHSLARRRSLMNTMGAEIDVCAQKHFNAVEFDNLDSFTRSHHLLSLADNMHFARMLVNRAHRDGLAAAQKNLASYNGTRLHFDFAVAEQCGEYDECKAYMRHYGSQVLMVEYDHAAFEQDCATYGNTIAIVYRDRLLKPSFTPEYC